MAGPKRASLKQSCPGCGAAVNTAKAEPLSRVPCPKCGKTVRAERTFDHFTLVEILGTGGMGTVYKARDTLLDRFVALKLLRPDLGTGIDHVAQLQHEARAAAAINHPNIVQVFSSGTDHGQFYLVMELVDHGSLDDLLERQKRLPERQVLEAGIQLARGLRAAQTKGLIHRDIKPANIFFAGDHTVKIGDFGLAGVAAQTAETPGEIWGTPYYVAPERLRNKPEDFRSDIYSLGATLYHALAGKPPIHGNTNSAAELSKLKQEPTDLREVARDVSQTTAGVFQRMIAHSPADRFSSYDELIKELKHALRQLIDKKQSPVRAIKPKFGQKTAIATVLLLLAGVAAFIFVRYPAATLEKIRAVKDELKMRTAFFEQIDDAEKRVPPATGATGGEKTQSFPDSSKRGSLSWDVAVIAYNQQIGRYNFAAARASIQEAQVSDASRKRSRRAMVKIAQWLVDWKQRLIADLNHTQFSGVLTDANGTQYSGIVAANDEQLMLQTRYGITGSSWTMLTPKMLLAISASFIWPDTPETADRQWLCAVFASETGQMEAARQFVEAAANAKPEYRQQIPLLLPPTSASR
jgi:serine/threonine protein kinase